MNIRELMEYRLLNVPMLADGLGVSRQSIHIAFARRSFSKELAGRISEALDAECVVMANGELSYRPNETITE